MAFLLLTAGVISAPTIGSQRRNNIEMRAQADASRGKAAIESRTLSVRIDQPFARVYEFLVDPANWNKWAFGLGKSLRRSCELLFTLFREPGITDEHYNADADFVQRDLNGLKELLEK
jgi:hypothetical protein